MLDTERLYQLATNHRLRKSVTVDDPFAGTRVRRLVGNTEQLVKRVAALAATHWVRGDIPFDRRTRSIVVVPRYCWPELLRYPQSLRRTVEAARTHEVRMGTHGPSLVRQTMWTPWPHEGFARRKAQALQGLAYARQCIRHYAMEAASAGALAKMAWEPPRSLAAWRAMIVDALPQVAEVTIEQGHLTVTFWPLMCYAINPSHHSNTINFAYQLRVVIYDDGGYGVDGPHPHRTCLGDFSQNVARSLQRGDVVQFLQAILAWASCYGRVDQRVGSENCATIARNCLQQYERQGWTHIFYKGELRPCRPFLNRVRPLFWPNLALHGGVWSDGELFIVSRGGRVAPLSAPLGATIVANVVATTGAGQPRYAFPLRCATCWTLVRSIRPSYVQPNCCADFQLLREGE